MAWGAEFEAVFDTVSDAVVGIFTWLWEQIEEILGWISKGMDLSLIHISEPTRPY